MKHQPLPPPRIRLHLLNQAKIVFRATSSVLILHNYRLNWAPWFKKSQTSYYNESVISEMENRQAPEKTGREPRGEEAAIATYWELIMLFIPPNTNIIPLSA